MPSTPECNSLVRKRKTGPSHSSMFGSPGRTFSTRVFRKPSNTNISIKPQSCQHPSTAVACFKGELCRAYRLCSDPEQIKREIDFTLDVFVDNGHNRKTFRDIANAYRPPTYEKKNKNNKRTQRPTTSSLSANDPREVPDNLFSLLPFHNVDLTEEEYKPYVCIPYLPGAIYHQIRKACNKAGVNVVAKSGTKLKDILCSSNVTKHDPLAKPGVYEFTCSCSDKAKYIGQTTRSIQTRAKEHKRAVETGNWHHSGISAHKEHCQSPIDWENPRVITTMNDKNKKKLNYDLKVREALEIRRHDCGPGRGLNEDLGAYVKSPSWNVVLHQMDNG